MRPGRERPGRLAWLWWLLWLYASVAGWAEDVEKVPAIEVEILQPASGVPLFDQVHLLVDVRSELPVRQIEIRLDGERIMVLDDTLDVPLGAPPYELSIDVGPENRDRRLEVLAIGESSRGRAVLLAPGIPVHDEVDLELQQLYITVTDRRNRPVLDLETGAFTVVDDGVEQDLVTVAAGDIPFSATLLIDGSHSMRGPRLASALAGAGRFLRDMDEHDEARILVHSDRLLGVTPGAAATIASRRR